MARSTTLSFYRMTWTLLHICLPDVPCHRNRIFWRFKTESFAFQAMNLTECKLVYAGTKCKFIDKNYFVIPYVFYLCCVSADFAIATKRSSVAEKSHCNINKTSIHIRMPWHFAIHHSFIAFYRSSDSTLRMK